MSFVPKNTIAYLDSLPQSKRISLAHIPVKNLAINCQAFLEKYGEASPEKEAIRFYAANHCMAIVRKKFTKNEALPAWAEKVVQYYTTTLAECGQRALIYLALITTREVRHTKKSSDPELKDALDAKFDKEVHKYIRKLAPYGGDSDGAVKKFMAEPPETTLGNWYSGITYAFNNGVYSSGYGGKKWGKVAEPLESFILGHTSQEMLLDTIWTLAHNGGPIFNKGMCYSHYDISRLMRILDIQRSGQIPEAILHDTVIQSASYVHTDDIVKLVQQHCPEEFGPEVDWYKVEALGAVQSYSEEKKYQKNKPQPKPVLIDGLKQVGNYQVFPGLSVPILSRKEIA